MTFTNIYLSTFVFACCIFGMTCLSQTLVFLAEEETDASTIPSRCPSLQLPDVSCKIQYEYPKLAPLDMCLVALLEPTSHNDAISTSSDYSDIVSQPIVKSHLPELHSD
ncbi:hypothetical protein BKA93DRAFT_162957 [Sparassis latifolia]